MGKSYDAVKAPRMPRGASGANPPQQPVGAQRVGKPLGTQHNPRMDPATVWSRTKRPKGF